MKSTVILVHGAFADSSSWDGVVAPLTRLGHTVVAFANPLRGVATDAALLTDLVASVAGPIVLVGHSYGGAVMTNVGASGAEVVGLVYVAGFALNPGETCGDASALAPGSTLGDTLAPVSLSGGGSDLYITQEKYHDQFAADLSPEQAATMAVRSPSSLEASAETAKKTLSSASPRATSSATRRKAECSSTRTRSSRRARTAEMAVPASSAKFVR